MITVCPNCGSQLHVTGLKCPDCGTAITGVFPMDELFKLAPEQLDFVKLFLRNEAIYLKCRRNWDCLIRQ